MQPYYLQLYQASIPIPERSLVGGLQCLGGVPIVHSGDSDTLHCVPSYLVNQQPILSIIHKIPDTFYNLLRSGVVPTPWTVIFYMQYM